MRKHTNTSLVLYLTACYGRACAAGFYQKAASGGLIKSDSSKPCYHLLKIFAFAIVVQWQRVLYTRGGNTHAQLLWQSDYCCCVLCIKIRHLLWELRSLAVGILPVITTPPP